MKISEILDFICKYSPANGVEDFRRKMMMALDKHMEYGTMMVLKDDNGISTFCRWNVDGDTAHVIELLIREDKRSYNYLRKFMKYAMKVNGIKKITWNRTKYPGRHTKQYEVL